MRLSDAGIHLLKLHEGLRLSAYTDSAGVWTIGWGHTGPDVQPGTKISEAEAEEFLREDLQLVERMVRHRIMTHLSQNEFDALVSLVYNLGPQVLDPKKSTLARKLREGDRIGVAGEFMRWHRAGGKPVLGLILRRWREAGVFLGVWDPLEDAA